MKPEPPCAPVHVPGWYGFAAGPVTVLATARWGCCAWVDDAKKLA